MKRKPPSGIVTFLTATLLALTFLTLTRCGTTIGNGLVNLSFKAYSIPTARAVVIGTSNQNLILCLKRVGFETDNQPIPDIDLSSSGDITVSGAGTVLGQIQLPIGAYQHIKFKLDNTCLSGKSVQLVNSNGSFSTTDSITMEFSGSLTEKGIRGTLALGVQSVVTALLSVTDGSQIKSKIESVSENYDEGDFQGEH